MGDMKEYFDIHKEQDKARKKRNLQNANPEGWTQHTEYYWSRFLNGKRLDYWPSRNKFGYDNKIMTGDVDAFIKKREK